MLNAQCSFLHSIPTLSEIPTEQIFKQSLLIMLPFFTHGTYWNRSGDSTDVYQPQTISSYNLGKRNHPSSVRDQIQLRKGTPYT